MELICGETSPTFVQKILIPVRSEANRVSMTFAAFDQNILSDDRIVEQLLQLEKQFDPNQVLESYKLIQTEIEPYMRNIIANWMLEVCEEMKCEEVIFALAMNYLDRFLICTDIRKNQLQLVGVVCLMIASKLRQCHNLQPKVLSYFTDYSVSVQEIIDWELLVLNRLKWDVFAVIAIDYLDHLLIRLTNYMTKNTEISSNCNQSMIRRHSSTFITLCTTELQFSCYSPSLIAAASVATAIHGLQSKYNQMKNFMNFVNTLSNSLGINANHIHHCIDQIEALVSSSTRLEHKFVSINTNLNKTDKTNSEENDSNIKVYYEIKIDIRNDILIKQNTNCNQRNTKM